MKQLSGLDATFLYLETPTTPMHTMAILVLGAGPPRITVDTVRTLLLNRLHHLPPLRQRLVDVPLGLDRPILVDADDFDIRNHVVRYEGPPPKTVEDLDPLAAQIASRPLDRSQPLWEAWFFDGLDGDEYAIVFKIHHAIVDGISAAAFLAQVLDTAPNARLTPTVAAPQTRATRETHPGSAALLGRAIRNQTRLPLSATRVALEATRGAIDLWRQPGEVDEDRVAWPLPLASPTPFDGSLSAERSFARGGAALEEFQFIRKAFDATMNDVLLAACTLAMRHHIASHGEVPHRPIIASIPVSIRAGKDEPSGNRVSNMLVRLPVQLERAEAVMQFVRHETRDAKTAHRLLGSRLIVPTLDAIAMPALHWLASQHERLGLADHHRPACNIIISNIPGPSEQLFFAGVPVRAAYPFGPLIDGTPLNLTAITYAGRLAFGLIACPTRAPHSEKLVPGFERAVAALRDAAERVRGQHLRLEGPRRNSTEKHR